jgi:hypothetical protein
MRVGFTLTLIGLCFSIQTFANSTGKSAAMKYFTKTRAPAQAAPAPAVQTTNSMTQSVPRSTQARGLVGISVGSLLNSQSYGWIDEDTGGWSVEAKYMRPSTSYLARGYHIELQKFGYQERELTKLSFLLSFSFPNNISFPVYIAAAAGPSYFVHQAQGNSEFAIDYRGYVGLRFNGSFGQYFLQSGVKNHVHVIDSGQFIGWFFSSGVAYTF